MGEFDLNFINPVYSIFSAIVSFKELEKLSEQPIKEV